MKLLEKAANVAVIIGVAAFIAVLARNEFAQRSVPPSESSIRAALDGKSVQLPGLSFPRAHPSLILALSVGCRFCQESVPFYRRLASQSQGKLDLVALFPQPKKEAEAYLQSAGVATTEIISAPLDVVKVTGTPTLILIDSNGKVRSVWVGKLDSSRERQVLSRISDLGR